VSNLHLYVYTRYKGDGFGFKYDKNKHFIKQDRVALDTVTKEIKQYL